ncbi:MAG TPA: hypothetical protein VEB86_19515, partial [Chryseosolibacter sp.]|nr:hypothetical protein [Chryseosolibacter sp.]
MRVKPFMRLWIVLCCIPTSALPQEGGKSNASLLPQIVPATPEAASFSKYGLYPVSHYTGVPEIRIPLHDISVGNVVVPVALNYHASGIKVTERASWAGLGWSLQCGGQISRKMIGLEDEHPNGYLHVRIRPTSEINKYDLDDLTYLNSVNTGILDTEPDIFSYSVGGQTGKFFFNHNRNFAVVKVPYTPLTIRRTGNLAFEMISATGETYEFNQATETDNTLRGITTAWLLSKIVSAEKHDTVSFSYASRSGQIHSDVIDYIVVSDQVDGSAYQSDQGVGYVKSQGVWATEQRLTQVSYPLGRVVFQSSAEDRADGFPGQKRLQSIHVYAVDPATNAPTLLKSILLHHSYFVSADGSENKRLRLDSLSITGA